MANYHITDADRLADGGAKTKARKNIAAIQLLKQIEKEQRTATSEEQAILILYTGWGVAADIFTTKPEWVALREELEAVLTEDEFAAARASTLNAFYTDVDITTEIYKGIERLGFTGGEILDPSMGATGIFEGAMPPDMASRSQISGVELDSISGRIASQLYPDSTVYVRGFQDVILPDDYFDLTISNVPFSEVGVKDPRYKDQPVNTLHDYFFAKGLDKVRPGGLLVYITSTGTMQSAKGEPFRQYLSDRANLIGAMRLPGDAFKKNAGTEVTTDLIILQKLGNGIEPNGVAWTTLKETNILNNEGKPLKTNEYYARQPELMLGELCDDKLYPGRLALKGDGRDISQAIRQAFEALPEAIYQPRLELEIGGDRILVPPELQSKVKQSAFTLHNGKLMVRKGDYLEPSDLTGKPYERVIGLIGVKEAVQKVFDVQLHEGTDLELEAAQSKLSKIYDQFVKANSYISSRGNGLAFDKDPDYPLLLALEKYDPETKTAQKTDIFSKRTIQAYKPRTEAENAKEGLLFSLNEHGRVDIDYIAQLTSQSKLEVVLDLQKEQLIFLDPAAQEWQTKDEYLSGNVKQKLEIAREATAEDSQFATNVEALEAVQPEPLLPGDIDVRLGSVWVPATDVETFAQELLGIEDGITVRHSSSANKWYVSAERSVRELKNNVDIFGTGKVEATTLIELALNLSNPTVYKTDPYDSDKRIVDQDETAAARLKQEEIKEKFKDWVWQDPERTERLTDKYNSTFNTNRERQYDGSHLELPGKNPNFVLRKHQADAVYRSLSGNMLLAHVVGAGKTAEMICSAMEQKRLGLATKPMFVVPNHLLEQWAGEIKHLYPTANILAATKKDSSAKNRQQLMSRIATGQWDAVVVTHTAFEKLQLSDAAQTQFLSEEYEKVKEAILSISNGGEESRRTMKDLERKKLSLEERIKEVAKSSSKDNTLTFEQLGIDLLVVDESHYFKNLGYVTKMRNIAGLPNTESKRAFDMHMKVRYMAQVRGEGKGVIFATGTPIANSMAELYTVQRYLQPKELERMGLASFDDWASVFGETVTSAELAATGKFQVKTRFSSFVNMPELMSSVRQVMDIQTADMLKLPVPELLGGKPTVVAVPATNNQLAYMDELVARAENMRNVEPWEDNMLKLTGNGRSASADMRLLFPEEPDDPDSKINQFVSDAFDFWEEHGNKKTHLVFCDLGTPKKAGEFSLYQDIKDKLVAKGVPESAIAFAQDYKTDAKKLQLQQNFNKGKIAILISGAQLETGFNGQRKLARISHLTVPWRPDQIEQRDGRMIRQGNENDVVESRRYVTQGRNGQPGIDGYFWQTLETKAGFIAQVMKGSTDIRRMSDVSTEALNYSEIKAIATGNPLIMEKATLDNTIRQLSAQKRSHTNANYRIRQELNRLPDKIDRLTETIEITKTDLAAAEKAQQSGKITLFGQTLLLHQEDEIGKRIRSTAVTLTSKKEKSNEKIGSFGKFALYVQSDGSGDPRFTQLRIEGENKYFGHKISGSKASAYRPLKELRTDLTEKLDGLSTRLAAWKKDLADLSQQTDKPFPKEDELAAAVKRLAEVHQTLKAETDTQKNKADSTTQRFVAPPERQETSITKRVAQLLISSKLERSVLSEEGFYLALKGTKGETDLIIDSNNGERIKLITDLPNSNAELHIKGAALTFSVISDGILTLESGEVESGPDIGKASLGLYFSQHLARTEYSHSPIDKSATVEASEPQDENTVEEKATIKSGAASTTPIELTAEQDLRVESAQSPSPTEQTEIASAPDEETPEEERVVLRIKSLSSGAEDEVTLPASGQMNGPASVTQTQKKGDRDASPTAWADGLKERISAAAKQESAISSKRSPSLDSSKSTAQQPITEQPPRLTMPPKEVVEKAFRLQLEADIKEAKEQTENGSSIYSGEHITISRNPQQKGIEVRFTDKPSKEWTQELKALKFRFSKKDNDARWYKKESKVSIPLLTAFAKKYETAMVIAIQPSKADISLSLKTPDRHLGQAEKNAAKLIHTAGLASKVVGDEALHLRVENGDFNNLVIQSQYMGGNESLLYLKQYTKDEALDCEAIFTITQDGGLRLEETATRNTFGSGEIRQRNGGDRLFAELITKNLIDQQYAERILDGEGLIVTEIAEPVEAESQTTIQVGDRTTVQPAISSNPAQSKVTVEAFDSASIAVPHEQLDLLEQNAAQFVYAANLASKLMQGDRFQLKVGNGVFNPLVIESTLQSDNSRQLRFSLYSRENSQPSMLVGEAVFTVDGVGKLSLKESAALNPVTTEVIRAEAGDRTFASNLISNILSQKYAEHIRQPSTSTRQEETSLGKPLKISQLTSIESERSRPVQLDLSQLSQQIQSPQQPVPALTSQLAASTEQEAQVLKTGSNASKTETKQPLTTRVPVPIQPLPVSSTKSTPVKTDSQPHTTSSIKQKPKRASSIVQCAIEKGDQNLHAALTSQEPTVSVSIEQLRDWYVSVQHQQKQPTPERLENIKEKGIKAASTGSTHLTPSEAQTMKRDIQQFASGRPETTVDDLRAWYRANLAGDRAQLSQIQKLAEEAKASGKNSIQLRPTDQLRMEKETSWLQAQIASQLVPDLRSIWAIATANRLTEPYDNNEAIFSGESYSIVSDKDGILTLTHKASESRFSISQTGDVLENGLTLKHTEEIQAIAQKMTQIVSTSNISQTQDKSTSVEL